MEPEKLRVLIIDDDADLAGLIACGMESVWTVCRAHNWTVAQARLRESRFDLILLDVFLPDTGTLDPLRAIREIDLDYPVVLMSGNVDRDDTLVEMAMRLGITRILAKPFRLADLQRHIAECFPALRR